MVAIYQRASCKLARRVYWAPKLLSIFHLPLERSLRRWLSYRATVKMRVWSQSHRCICQEIWKHRRREPSGRKIRLWKLLAQKGSIFRSLNSLLAALRANLYWPFKRIHLWTTLLCSEPKRTTWWLRQRRLSTYITFKRELTRLLTSQVGFSLLTRHRYVDWQGLRVKLFKWIWHRW